MDQLLDPVITWQEGVGVNVGAILSDSDGTDSGVVF